MGRVQAARGKTGRIRVRWTRTLGRKPRAPGGGGVRMTPVGALEIGPEGTRFIHFHPLLPLLGAGAVGMVAGWLLARRR